MSAAIALTPLAAALAGLSRAVGMVRAAAAADPYDATCALARAADAINAATVDLLTDAEPIERRAGMSAELALSNGAGLMHRDARALMATRDALAHMPAAAAALASGAITFSQAKAISWEVRELRVADRAQVDALVERIAPKLEHAEPEALVFQVGCEVARLTARSRASVERRNAEAEFLWVQPDFDGGARLYAQGGADTMATILEAVDSFAERPHNPDDPGAPTRAHQRYSGLVQVCERALAGGDAVGRPRPRVHVTADARDLAELGASEAARLMWNLPGRAPALSPELARMLACDAELVPVLFDGARLLSFGNPTKTIPDKIRQAVLIRDGGCRFPGHHAPVGWCEVHHAVPGCHDPNLLVSLCRTCHSRVHDNRMKVRPLADGTIEFRHAGKTYRSVPRTRPLRE